MEDFGYMKLLLLADINAQHTVKWVRSLSQKGVSIVAFGFNPLVGNPYEGYSNISIYTCDIHTELISKKASGLSKYSYLNALPIVKKIIYDFKPDIVHAHYASSYGLIGALSGFRPYILSVWGSDVYDFPNRSFFHKKLLQYNLYKADKVLSTSYVMAQETNKYTEKEIEVTPFGIDVDVFKPKKVKGLFNPDDIVIGTIKDLEDVYGIEYLIKAFKILKDKYVDLPLKLLIVGGGSQESYLKILAKELNVQHDTIFTGKVDYDKISDYHNMLSIYVAVSKSESFGVAILEACACEKPVIVSAVGGLPEVVKNNVTGLVVKPQNPEEAARAIEKLVLDQSLRVKMGIAGRTRVQKLYNWDVNVKQMINIYDYFTKRP